MFFFYQLIALETCLLLKMTNTVQLGLCANELYRCNVLSLKCNRDVVLTRCHHGDQRYVITYGASG